MTVDVTTMTPTVAVLRGDNPFDVPRSTEFLSPPDHDDPRWSETMFFMVWDPSSELGLWIHAGVVPEDKTLWWAQTFALLPGGMALVDRSFGRTTETDGPQVGSLRIQCVDPLRAWRLTFDGAGEISSTIALAAGPAGAGVAAPFRFDVELTAASPVYDMHRAMGADIDWDAGHIHHEQAMLARGTLTALGQEHSLVGASAIRDHSVGGRDFTRYGGHVWTHIVWPQSSRSLGLMQMWRPRTYEVAMSIAMLRVGDTTEITPDGSLTGLTAYGGFPRELQFGFRRADGTRVTLRGKQVHNVTMTYAEPNHNLNGNWSDPALGLNDPIVADESIIAWEWTDGEVGYGHVERGFRPSMLPMPATPRPSNCTLGAE